MHFEQRLERLERHNRRLRVGFRLLLFTIAVGGLAGLSNDNPVPDLIEAKSFHVVGEDGSVLVKLEDSLGLGLNTGGTLTTFDGDGQELVQLAATAGGTGRVTTLNGKGQALVRIGATPGGGAVTTLNGTGQGLVQIGTTVDGHGTLTTLDGNGQQVVDIGVTTSGAGVLTIVDGKGNDLIELAIATDGTGMVVVHDPSVRGRRGVLEVEQPWRGATGGRAQEPESFDRASQSQSGG